MNKAYRTFILWSIWSFAATTIYLGLYIDTDILSFLRNDQSRITWIIVFLFFIGIIGSLLLTIIITGEAIEAQRQTGIAEKKGLMGLRPTQRKRKSVNRFYDSLKVVASSNETPDLDALIHMEFATYQRMSHSIEVLGNLLITLGLIGTVLGLTFTLSGLTSSLDALGQDQDMLLAGLRKAMSGMGTAFYTTLLGAILGGVLLRIYALITDNGVSALQDSLYKTCMVYLCPDFQPTVEREIRFLNSELEALGSRVTSLRSVFTDTKESINEFHDAIKELNTYSGDANETYTLKETLRMQKYYRLLLKQELQLMHKLNRSWWTRFKEYLPTKDN